jgi:dihydroorotate dehydrogenase
MIYISPPFGNWVWHKDCVRVRGTFTVKRRPGLIVQILKTLRKVDGGWCNAIGFRNAGLKNIKFKKDSIYSVAALDNNWIKVFNCLPKDVAVELNVGCPNVGNYTIKHKDIKLFLLNYPNLTVKVSPHVTNSFLDLLQELGVKRIHLSNTLPSKRGGISGKQLKKKNLELVRFVSRNYNFEVIAGGGIYTPEDVRDYANVGAKHYSLSTIWFTPWRVKKVIEEIKSVEKNSE